jgi:signal transduction histidine kinase
MPTKTGCVFVVVVHLDPTHDSLMPELLSHATGLTVEQARDRQPLEADHVYVIPPNRTLTIDQGLVRVSEVADRRSLRGAVDHFFRSLAVAERERAVAIVLSGTGTEGTLGARAVKAEGGLVMAQAPDTAAQPGMPTSVIATALVDVVLAPDKMPQALLTYVRNAHRAAPAMTEAKPPDVNSQLQDKVDELTAVNDDLANLIASTDIATVFLDTDLHIKRFTTAASHVLNLQPSDTGRPMNHLASNLIDVDLSREARSVLQTVTPLEKAVAAKNGRQYFLRTLPYRTEDDAVEGVVLTLVDVTTLKRTESDLRAAREQMGVDLRRMTRLHELSAQLLASGDLRSMLESVIRAALDITAADKGNVQLCDDAGVLTIAAQSGFDDVFLGFFARVDASSDSACGAAMASRQRVLVEDITASPIFMDQPSLPMMIASGVRAVQSTPLFDRAGHFLGLLSTHYRDAHHFEETEVRWLDLLARHAADVIERQAAEDRLAVAHDYLEARVADRTRWLSLMHEVSSEINAAATWDEALHRVLRRLCQAEHWQIGYVYLPRPEDPDTIAPVISCFGDDRFKAFHDLSMHQTYARGDRLPGRVLAENEPFWAIDTEALMAAIPVRAATATAAGLRAGVAFPISIRGEVVAVLEIFSDHAHPPSEQLTTLMHNVSDQIGRVLERERATARMADLVWREQQELLHTLHDSLGQTLTGLGMLSTGLRQRLAADSESAETAAEIARQSQQALDQVRLLAKGLFPVEVEAESLLAALRDLAIATERLHNIRVRVDGARPEVLRDGKIATELYRIAQEAVTNSVKHAQASTITIRIEGTTAVTRLQITDDGVGIAHPESGNGSGLRIMRYRAASIGASLSVERGTTGGTVVTCTIRQPPTSR